MMDCGASQLEEWSSSVVWWYGSICICCQMAAGWTDCVWGGCFLSVSFGLCADNSLHWLIIFHSKFAFPIYSFFLSVFMIILFLSESGMSEQPFPTEWLEAFLCLYVVLDLGNDVLCFCRCLWTVSTKLWTSNSNIPRPH